MFPHLSKFNLRQWIEENREIGAGAAPSGRTLISSRSSTAAPIAANNSTSTKVMKFSISSKASSISTTSIRRRNARYWC